MNRPPLSFHSPPKSNYQTYRGFTWSIVSTCTLRGCIVTGRQSFSVPLPIQIWSFYGYQTLVTYNFAALWGRRTYQFKAPIGLQLDLGGKGRNSTLRICQTILKSVTLAQILGNWNGFIVSSEQNLGWQSYFYCLRKLTRNSIM